MEEQEIRNILLDRLKTGQRQAVASEKRRLMLIAGAGSGKTEVMARRVAWLTSIGGVPKKEIVAFTFTEAAAEELKFRIRRHIEAVTPQGADTTLGGMYVGTIHGFCLFALRELSPDRYHNFDVVDEGARLAFAHKRFRDLELNHLRDALRAPNSQFPVGQFETLERFLRAYDLMNEYNELDVELASDQPPSSISEESSWCRQARLKTFVGSSPAAQAFAISAARFYAYLKCRRFLDFSTIQSELLRLLGQSASAREQVTNRWRHVVVDEVQDINPVQSMIVRMLVGEGGGLTAVGDHRQAIYGFRGSRIELMAQFHGELTLSPDGEVIELYENFRSTPLIIGIANAWSHTIGQVGTLTNPEMKHGKNTRADYDSTHVCQLTFATREDEASWIAEKIGELVRDEGHIGASHDTPSGERGITFNDIAILLRSSTDARAYQLALESRGIPAIFRAGPDLFYQPEALLFLGVLGLMGGINNFWGSWHDSKSIASRTRRILQCNPEPVAMIRAACQALANSGLGLEHDAPDRLIQLGTLINLKLTSSAPPSADTVRRFRSPELRRWLLRDSPLRRVFPQKLYHWALGEAHIERWDSSHARAISALYHLGQLSTLVKSIETPGWTPPGDFKYSVIALAQWGAENARADLPELLVPPNAVTITTIHSAKGLQWPAVFLADVNSRRFPSSKARTRDPLPFDGAILNRIDPAALADNDNNDAERRLMYVALTRAERYLSITCSGNERSKFFRQLTRVVQNTGGTVATSTGDAFQNLRHLVAEMSREIPLVTSFSDLRYYWQCPHDFYFRKILGFTPTIDQSFGYGRGVHNLLRHIHSEPRTWAALAQNSEALGKALEALERRGLIYLRYTVGDPEENLKRKALQIVGNYIQQYAEELENLTFEPEREFETLIPEEQLLISGAIDLVRLDDPPEVTIIDFKSGDTDSDIASKLTPDEMERQIALYGMAARHELEYEPRLGLVRYLAEGDPLKKELKVSLSDVRIAEARENVKQTVQQIRAQQFHKGPADSCKDRCATCDFIEFCGMGAAQSARGRRR